MLVTGAQLRAARAMAALDQETLAGMSGISSNTIRKLEKVNGPLSGRVDTLRALQRALEAAGIEFINSERPGVRTRETVA